MGIHRVSGSRVRGNTPSDSKSEDIAQAQRILRELGYGELRDTGTVDRATREAIRRFQEDNGLPASGELTRETVQALRNRLARRRSSTPSENVRRSSTERSETEPQSGVSRDAFRVDAEIRMVQIGYASANVQLQGISPLNRPYRNRSPVSDSTPVFQNNRLDANRLLRILSQYDRNRRTVEDPRRCGVTSMLAVVIKQKGVDGLRKVIEAVRSRIDDDLASDPPENIQRRLRQYLGALDQLLRRIESKTLTFGDLGKLQEIMYEVYKSSDGQTTGISGVGMLLMVEDFELRIPSSLPRRPEDLRPGEMWPVLIPIYDRRGNLVTRHWIIMGKDENGRPFFYDPMPNSEGQQIFYKSNDTNDLSNPYAKYILYLQENPNMPLPLSFDSAFGQ